MKYDKDGMRWVREGLDKVDEAGESRVVGSEESEDVFAGMESWKEGSAPHVGLASEPGHPPERLSRTEAASAPQRPAPIHAASAPAILTPAPVGSSSLHPIRSALRNANSATPAGGLKKRTGWHESVTPAGEGSSGTKRSVSFSDGKRSGKIDLFESGAWEKCGRERGLEGILGDMEDLSALLFLSDAIGCTPLTGTGLDDGTPSKAPRCVESSNPPLLDEESRESPTRAGRKRAAADATFLTECSFGVTHDRLVQLITDVYGSEPWWDHLRSLDLRGKGVDSVARLHEFLPELDEVILFVYPLSFRWV